MPERGFEDALDESSQEWIRAWLETHRGKVVKFVVQYETTLDGKRVAVTRYDSAHGRPHQDVLNRRGDVTAKKWLDDLTNAQVVTMAEQDIHRNWRTYRARFLKDSS